MRILKYIRKKFKEIDETKNSPRKTEGNVKVMYVFWAAVARGECDTTRAYASSYLRMHPSWQR